MNDVVKYLQECGTFFLATVEGDQPHVRPFGAVCEFEGKLYIVTNNKKDVYNQMKVNGKVNINGTIKIVIADNGHGFDVNEKLNHKTGEGLTNMKNRLSSLNGKLGIVSTSNGTQITLEIPLPKE